MHTFQCLISPGDVSSLQPLDRSEEPTNWTQFIFQIEKNSTRNSTWEVTHQSVNDQKQLVIHPILEQFEKLNAQLAD